MQYRKLILEYLQKIHMGCCKVKASKDTNVVTVLRWPSMQGQGIEAAASVETKWDKLVKYGNKIGVKIIKPYEY